MNLSFKLVNFLFVIFDQATFSFLDDGMAFRGQPRHYTVDGNQLSFIKKTEARFLYLKTTLPVTCSAALQNPRGQLSLCLLQGAPDPKALRKYLRFVPHRQCP